MLLARTTAMAAEYYNIDQKEVFNLLGSSEKGLSLADAGKRLVQYGKNEIEAQDKRTAISILAAQFLSPLVLILIFASLIAGFLGEATDMMIILAIVLINAALGFYQEFKSERALAELKKYISFKARVLRGGEEIEVDDKDLVLGDVVFLEIGDVVPADIRLIESHKLTADESMITGESLPVEKDAGEVSLKNAQPSQQSNMAFMGTIVSSGMGRGIVVATGKNTEFGRTATVLSAREPPTDFQKSINKFGSFLIKVILLLTIFVFASNALLGKGMLESFLFALALAVGITPELLPIIITISLSAGAMHLAKNKVVVKRLAAIEGLGNIDILCMDKTGTLTENKITLEQYTDADGKKSSDVLDYALLCNEAIREKGKAEGNTIDVAVWGHPDAKRAGLGKYKKIQEVEFDFDRRRMGMVVEAGKKRLYICKGAPESVLSACSHVEKDGKQVPVKGYRKKLESEMEKLSGQGFRVVAVAFKEVGFEDEYTDAEEFGLAFKGFLTFLDPPKKTAMAALKTFKELGVELKLLTGDNELVTREVCREVGFGIYGRIVLGSELERMSEREFAKAASENSIFARITPEQKYKIVGALTKQGHIVGFLGDGVNDAPALKLADVGITVDSAVDVAKDSADVILLKKSLSTLADGIKEGRRTFGNIMKYILNTISANFGNMFTLTLSTFVVPFIPLLPSQILLNNLISDGPLTTISTDNVDEEYLKKPKKWNMKGISHFMVFFGAISMVFDFATIAVMLLLTGGNAALFRTAWFLESVLSEIIITFAIRTKRPFWKSMPSKMLIYSSLVCIGLSVWVIYSPMDFLFDFEQLGPVMLGAIAVILAGYFAMAEVAKRVFYKKYEI